MNRIHKVLAVIFLLNMLFCMPLSAEIIRAYSIHEVLHIAQRHKGKRALIIFDEKVLLRGPSDRFLVRQNEIVYKECEASLQDCSAIECDAAVIMAYVSSFSLVHPEAPAVLNAVHALGINSVCLTNRVPLFRSLKYAFDTYNLHFCPMNLFCIDAFNKTEQQATDEEDVCMQKGGLVFYAWGRDFYFGRRESKKSFVFKKCLKTQEPLEVVIVVSSSLQELGLLEQIATQEKILFEGIVLLDPVVTVGRYSRDELRNNTALLQQALEDRDYWNNLCKR